MPTRLSVGCDIWWEMGDENIRLAPCFKTEKDDSGYSWRGLPIKVVLRKGYVEAMPRRRAARKPSLENFVLRPTIEPPFWLDYPRTSHHKKI
jgi:hypothetical protein